MRVQNNEVLLYLETRPRGLTFTRHVPIYPIKILNQIALIVLEIMHVKENPRWQPSGHIEFLIGLKFDRLDAKRMGFFTIVCYLAF